MYLRRENRQSEGNQKGKLDRKNRENNLETRGDPFGVRETERERREKGAEGKKKSKGNLALRSVSPLFIVVILLEFEEQSESGGEKKGAKETSLSALFLRSSLW